jgi:hypothetical protein
MLFLLKTSLVPTNLHSTKLLIKSSINNSIQSLHTSSSSAAANSSSRIKLLNFFGHKNFFLTRSNSTSANNAIGGGKQLFAAYSKKESLISSHLSLFIRRQRILANSSKKALQNEKLKGTKVNASGIRRLLSLAKPEKYKIAG